MSRIYISSTYSDLKDYREAAYRALRKLGHDVIAMEDYTATDERPLRKCLEDVARCDMYVGIFAWRYGFIPTDEKASISELEYNEAERLGKKCLIFLVDESAPWPRNLIDESTSQIDAFREKLKLRHVVEFFDGEDDLTGRISIAVSNAAKVDIVAPQIPYAGPRSDSDTVKKEAVLLILRPIVYVLAGILAISIFALVLVLVIPAFREGVDVWLAMTGLGGVSALSSSCLMMTISKVVAAAQA